MHMMITGDKLPHEPDVDLRDLQQRPELVQALLAEHEASVRKVEQLQPRKLGPGLKAVIWSLRIYVVFMVVVAIIQVIHTLQ